MIRLLTEADAEPFFALRREALRDAPLSFSASPADDVTASVDAVREQMRRGADNVIFGAFADALVGAVGLARDATARRHTARICGVCTSRRCTAGAVLPPSCSPP